MSEDKKDNFRRYNIQRELKATLKVNSNKGIIYMPEGMKLGNTDQKRVDALISEFGYVIQPEMFDISVWQKVMIGRSIGLRGKSINFKKERMYGILPGTALIRIGKGRSGPKNRVDTFSQPGKYAGTILIEGIKYYAVLLPKEKVQESDLPHYLLYEDGTHGQLKRNLYKANGNFDYARVYQAAFKLTKPAKEKERQAKLKL